MQGYETNTKSPLTVYTSTRSCIMYTSMKGHMEGFIKLGSPLQFSG